MKVVRHDADAVHLNRITRLADHHQVKKRLVVGICEKQAATIVSAIDDMMRVTGERVSWFSGRKALRHVEWQE